MHKGDKKLNQGPMMNKSRFFKHSSAKPIYYFQYKMNEYSTKEQNSVSSCVETSVWSSAEKILGAYNY